LVKAMTNEPLLVLSEQRLQHEVQRALAVAAAAHYQLVRKRRLIAACLLEFIGGLTLMGLGFHVTGEDFGQALFLGGVIVGYLGPAWTWILANWHGGECRGDAPAPASARPQLKRHALGVPYQ